MENEEIEPTNINKHPRIIKESQNDIGRLDILVCGQCHSVFHFIEQFQEHRLMGNCTGISSVRDSNTANEPKPQVWAFLLWKNSQPKSTDNESDNSWFMYQRWCKMDQTSKEAWIEAGRNVQTFTRLSTAKMQEVRKTNASGAPVTVKPSGTPGFTMVQKLVKRSPPGERYDDDGLDRSLDDTFEDVLDSGSEDFSDSELDTEEEYEREEALKRLRQENANAKKVQDKVEVKTDADEIETKTATVEVKTTIPNLPKKPEVVIDVSSRTAIRTGKEKGTETEATIEKILAKRFNPRRKLHEYLIKWEGCTHEENTWEPAAHMDTCKHLLEAFERNLAKQKEQKAAAAAAQAAQRKAQQQKMIASPGPSGVLAGRPQRTSKQKAMDQVKAWCGNISDINEETGRKRKGESDSDDELDEKRLKAELGSEDDEDEFASDENSLSADDKRVVRKYVRQDNTLNGVSKKTNTNEIAKSLGLVSPDNKNAVVMANKVRFDPKQIGNVSSGVFVMDKETGVLKVVSGTPTTAATSIIRVQAKPGTPAPKTSAGIVRITPKIGQVRVVSKEAEPAVRMTQTPTIKPNITVRSAGTGRPVGRPKNPGKAVTPDKKPNVQKPAVASPTVRVIRGGKTNVTHRIIRKVPDPVTNKDDLFDDSKASSESSEDDFDPFPKDLPPVEPEPESPPGEFTLCPLTGRVLGQDYPEEQPQENSVEMKEPDSEKTEDVSIKDETEKQHLSLPILTEALQGGTLSENADVSMTENLNDAIEPVEPLMITGEDGVVYQVAGQNEEGQTLLVAQGPDGQQQCVYVTTQSATEAEGAAVEQLNTELEGAEQSEIAQLPEQLTVNTDAEQSGTEDSQVVAEIVKAELPSPGGTRKVVLLLPDGNLMMTEVDAEQYAALELDQ